MGYLSPNGITWKNLQAANVARLPEFKNTHGQPAHTEPDGSDWSPAQWLQAVTGELGEYANFRKKFERGDITEEEFKVAGGFELADTVIYLSILAFRLGIDLDEAVREKFNITSSKVKSRVYIGDDWEHHLAAATATPDSATPPIHSYWQGQGGIYLGIVFDVKTQRQWHLILADAQTEADWGAQGKEVDDCNSYTDGLSNTLALLRHTHEHPAAQWAASLSIDGHMDFYLPAQKELNLIYTNASDLCKPAYHWSSTQHSANRAWYQVFEYGGQTTGSKDSQLAVRAVRRIPI